MTDDPMQRLRNQLVDAANSKAATAAARPARRTHRATWLAIGLAAIAVPAGAATTGIIDLGSGSTPDGGSYSVTRSDDDRASSDPTRTDDIGRTCENITFRDKNGAAQTFGQNCRPRGAKVPESIVSAGFDVTPDGSLLIRGTARNDVAKVTVSGVNGPIKLTKDRQDDLQRFDVITTQEAHTIAVYDDADRLLDMTTVTPG